MISVELCCVIEKKEKQNERMDLNIYKKIIYWTDIFLLCKGIPISNSKRVVGFPKRKNNV